MRFEVVDENDLLGQISTWMLNLASEKFELAKQQTDLNKAYLKGLGHEIRRMAFQVDQAILVIKKPSCNGKKD